MAHIERDIKLRLTPQAFTRLVRLAPNRRNLASVYYDTARQDLRRAGIALRLRRDGGRWLQTLKAESAQHAGLAARAEWELPVRRKTLEPDAFPREEIRSATGIDLPRLARRLRPVFETRFTRRSGLVQVDGKASAEFAIDRGRILAGSRREAISEVELELISGDTGALLRFAEALALPLAYESKAERGYRLATGLAPAARRWRMPALEAADGPGKGFAAVFAAALTQAGTNAAGVLGSRDPEYLHQLRVGLRRLRSALQAFAPVLEGEKPLKRALRRLVPALGTARDWDVFVQTLEKLRVAPQVLRAARSSRNSARRAARAALASAAFRAFLFQSLRWMQGEPWLDVDTTLAGFAPQRLEKLHRRAVRQVDLQRPKRRHELRIRIKRLRYACEFFAPCFPPDAVEPYVKALRSLQGLFGELNDIAVARRLLREMQVAAPGGLTRREQRLTEKVRAAWESFEKQPPYWRPPG
jgi:inorganic triphosphatase YgiF